MKKAISLLLVVILASMFIIVSAVSAMSVESFTIVDAKTDRVVANYQNLNSNTQINLDDLPAAINIVANTQGDDVDSVRFFVNDRLTRTENIEPYAIAGDLQGNYYTWDVKAGTYNIKATPFDRANGRGDEGSSKELTLTFTQGSTTSRTGSDEITKWYLINSRTNTVIRTLKVGETNYVNLNEVGTNLNVRADASSDVESVKFYLNGAEHRTENVVPYALHGDLFGNYRNWRPSTRSYQIQAVPFSRDSGRGNQGDSSTITIEFNSNAVSDNSGSGSSSSGFSSQGIYLVNSQTDQVIKRLSSNEEVNLNQVGDKLNIVAHFTGSTSSANMRVDGSFQGTESEKPYSFFKDTDADYWDWTPSLRDYDFSASAGGTTISVDNVRFTRGGSSDSGNQGSGNDDSNDNNDDSGSNNDVPGTGTGADDVDYDNPVADDETTTGTTADGVITSEFRKWHPVEIQFSGPNTNENANPNPFLDYRLDVRFFSPSGVTYIVPGHYAADGNAANTGATSGNKWRVYFTPDETGEWYYVASFRTGDDVAVNLNENSGQPTSFDGASGTFTIRETNKVAPDFRSKGRLSYVGEHYLQFEETGEYFLKAGSDAPENLLAFADFDNTPNTGSRRKTYSSHVQDFNTGDPTWMNGKGRGIIGAVNYMASERMNVMSFLTMNIGGDDKNVFPYVEYNNNNAPQDDRLRFDVSKVDQWDIVFAHMQKKGIYLHFKTQETENDQLLDGGNVGVERKLYYRELISRFGYHLALNWNMGEENTQTTNQRKEMAAYFAAVDPYQHNRVIHTYPTQQDIYSSLLGSSSEYTGASLQNSYDAVYDRTYEWVTRSANAGKKWVVANDEQGHFACGVPPDGHQAGQKDDRCDYTTEDIREETLWGNLMAGGAGVEYYFGYALSESDLTLENFRSRDKVWDDARYALYFFNNFLPFVEMTACEDRIDSGAYCFGKQGDIYALYTESGNIQADLPSGTYTAEWYNPKTGEFVGNKRTISGGDNTNFGTAPFSGDAALLVVRNGYTYTPSGLGAPGYTPEPNGGPDYADVDTPVDSGNNNGGSSSGSSGVFQESNGIVVIEAENYETQTENQFREWRKSGSGISPDPDANHASSASGGEYLELLPDTRVDHNDPLVTCQSFNNNPNNCVGSRNVLSYQVDFDTAGRYYVWVRTYSTGSEDNGIHVGINGQWPDSGRRMQWCSGKNQWTWESKQRTDANHCGVAQQIYIDVPSAGEHTIEFAMREDGFEFDKFILERTSRGFNKPSGTGPAQSPTN